MDIKLNLILQEPIDFYGIPIQLITFEEIFKYGIDKFNQLLIPFSITIDLLENELSEEDKLKIKNFDLVVSDKSIFQLLIQALQLFCKTDDIQFVEEGIKIKDGILNRDNFDEFAIIILQICARERQTKERVPIFKNDLQRDIWTKLQEGRKREAKKNELKLEDVINIVQYGGKSFIPKEEIKKFTLWEMMNAYKTILGISNYQDSFSIYLISGEKSLVEGKHWTELIKIDNKSKE